MWWLSTMLLWPCQSSDVSCILKYGFDSRFRDNLVVPLEFFSNFVRFLTELLSGGISEQIMIGYLQAFQEIFLMELQEQLKKIIVGISAGATIERISRRILGFEKNEEFQKTKSVEKLPFLKSLKTNSKIKKKIKEIKIYRKIEQIKPICGPITLTTWHWILFPTSSQNMSFSFGKVQHGSKNELAYG